MMAGASWAAAGRCAGSPTAERQEHGRDQARQAAQRQCGSRRSRVADIGPRVRPSGGNPPSAASAGIRAAREPARAQPGPAVVPSAA